MIEYSFIRSRRKTIMIQIRNGEVFVRAPINIPKRDIDSFVSSKEKWITDKLAISFEQQRCRESFQLNYGDKTLLLGVGRYITEKGGNRAGFDGNVFYMPSSLTSEQIKDHCIRIYRRVAKAHLHERVSHYSKLMNASPLKLRINGAKTRWGSCSSKKNINFSWRLIMADSDVIDYVVVHELAHLTEMNHSERFWTIVERVLPDYRQRKKRLRELQHRLAEENWE